MSLPLQFALFIIILAIVVYVAFFGLFMIVGKRVLKVFTNIKKRVKKGDEE